MTASTANLWAVAGLVYALAGAALLALSVFAMPQPVQNAPSRELRHSVEQWLDARLGAALIVVGFFLQATGSVGSATLNTPAVFVLLGLAFAAAYYAMTKDLLVDKLIGTASVPATSPSHSVAVVERAEPAAAVAPILIVTAPEPEAETAAAEAVVVDLRPRESTG